MVTLSVVMSVYNGAATLEATLAGIAAQTIRDYELIVVDDGSTDATPDILAAHAARDPRMRVLTQPNGGLTAALIRGCAEARGTFIARHDCGDRSMPQRFEKQLARFEGGPVLVACATRHVEAEGDLLYVSRARGAEVRESLLHDDAARIHGIPQHGSAMFRRDAYLQAGGYRPQFRVAQDLDLWIRLARLGTIDVVDEELYEATVDARGISGTSRPAQVALTAIMVALRDGGDETELLAQAARIAPSPPAPRREAAGLYFIGKCLLQQKNPRWRGYIVRALRNDPLHLRAWASLILRR
ncbi:MAG TPA: glycosyltransferase family 2 protein [Thermoanaerobaculia bacterium]|jgi:glycosyltransferase involved in cell wall biosynthesis